MGKWYLGVGAEKFGNTKTYKEIDPLHASVHDSVLRNHEYVKKGTVLKGENPKAIFKNFSEMEESSRELFKKLDEMVQEYMKSGKK